MINKNKVILIILAILIIIQVGLLFLFLKYSEKSSVLRTFYEGPTFIDSLYEAGKKEIPNYSGKVYAGIVPHHLIAGDKIAAFYQGLEKEKYKTIILLSPDHFGLTKNNIIISASDWQTPYGLLENDKNLAQKIVKETDAVYVMGEGVAREHGMNYELPFIKKSFHKAKIVAIAIKKETTQKELDNFLQILEKNINPEKTLLLASIDFSHDAPSAIARERDQKSQEIINNLDFKNYQEIQADCPAALYLIMKYAKNKQYQPKFIWRTDSGELTNKPEEIATSHNFYYFQGF